MPDSQEKPTEMKTGGPGHQPDFRKADFVVMPSIVIDSASGPAEEEIVYADSLGS
jgi:hypothetical protein